MKTFTDLKRDLTVGRSLTMIYHENMETDERAKSRIGQARFIVKKQTNGVYLNPDKTATKGSFLELPRASLVEYDGKIITVYGPSKRPLTESEAKILKDMPSHKKENEQQCVNDIMTDGSTMYWRDKAYLKANDALWYDETYQGKHYNHNDQLMIDYSLKGKKELSYKLE